MCRFLGRKCRCPAGNRIDPHGHQSKIAKCRKVSLRLRFGFLIVFPKGSKSLRTKKMFFQRRCWRLNALVCLLTITVIFPGYNSAKYLRVQFMDEDETICEATGEPVLTNGDGVEEISSPVKAILVCIAILEYRREVLVQGYDPSEHRPDLRLLVSLARISSRKASFVSVCPLEQSSNKKQRNRRRHPSRRRMGSGVGLRRQLGHGETNVDSRRGT